jgi:drug/metabolite transporter (DMT)-like permease
VPSVFSRLAAWLYQQPFLLVSITYLVWAINIVLGRYAAGHIPPIALTFWRWALAFFILLPFAWPHLKRDWPIVRRHVWILTVLSIFGTAGYNALAYYGLQYTEAINALLIQSTMPMAVGLMAFLLLGDRLTARQMIGIAISFLGVVVILVRGDAGALLSIAFNRGDIWFILAMLDFAVYSALVKKRPAMHPISFLAVTMGWGTLWLIPVYIWEIASGAHMTFDVKTVWILIYVAVFPSIVAYICFNRGIELVGPNRAAALYPLIVVFGSVIAMVFLGERPQLFHLAGFVLVIAGLLLATRTSRVAQPN